MTPYYEDIILNNIKYENLGEEWQYIADHTGLDMVITLMRIYGGQRVTIPLPKKLAKDALKNFLIQKKRQGIILSQMSRLERRKIAAQFEVNENLFNKIVQEIKEEYLKDCQPKLGI